VTLPPWLKDPKAQAGIGAVAVLALFVLWRRSRSASSASSSGATTTVPTGSAGAGSPYDSTSTDIANQLGQYQTGLQTALGQSNATQQAALDAYQKQLTTDLAGLTSGTPKTPTSTTLAPGYGWFATGGTSYTPASIANRYGITTDALLSLNPTLVGKTTVPKNTPVKVRNNAGPWSLAAYRAIG
jgi:hypothetical protein